MCGVPSEALGTELTVHSTGVVEAVNALSTGPVASPFIVGVNVARAHAC